MEQMKKLNTTDGWENIVNANAMQRGSARERVAAKKKARRLRKLWLGASGIAILGLTFVILGVTGAVADWLGSLVSVASVTASSFVLGRYVEAKKG